MKIKDSRFIISAAGPAQYPEEALPEIAMAGRSNVGKSSLINMLLNRKGLAKTSSTPGKTRLINFYQVENTTGAFRLVDLPGYGYARVSKSSKESWGKLIENYLKKRDPLMEVFLLVDARHEPTAEDVQMYSWIRKAGFNGIVVATKADKLSKNQLQAAQQVIRKKLNMDPDAALLPVSSETRDGKYEIWDVINILFQVNGYPLEFQRQEASK